MLLSLMAGSKEDAEAVSAFFQDMRARALNDPLLVVSDGAAGIVKAIETCFPRSARQRCLAHRMRNLSAKVLKDVRPDFKARDLAAGLVRDDHTSLPSTVACFQDDFEAMIAHLRLPVTHRRATRTTNLCLNACSLGRRLKIIPNAFGEKAVLKLIFAAMTRAAERWRAVGVAEFERRQMDALGDELDQEYEGEIGPKRNASTGNLRPDYPARLGLDRWRRVKPK